MSGEFGYIYSHECMMLREAAARCKERIRQTEDNKQKAVSLDNQIEENSILARDMDSVRQKVKPRVQCAEEKGIINVNQYCTVCGELHCPKLYERDEVPHRR